MESEAKIRRLHFVQKHSISKIVRDTGVCRNTVRRVIRAKKAGKSYKRLKQPIPKLNQFKPTLESWLSSDHRLSKKERRSAMKYYTQLEAMGYQGAYDSVQRFVKAWRCQNRESFTAYIPLSFSPAEAYQFDWSEEIVELGGVVQKIKVAHCRLCYSRKFFLAAYMRETQEMLFDAHNRAFIFFGGLVQRGIYDNMKTAVDSVFVGKERVFNRRFLSLMDHYFIEPTACNPAAGWEKGQVEKQVENIRDWAFRPRLKFANLAELNNHLVTVCQSLAEAKKHPDQKELSIEAVFQKEGLRALIQPFDGYSEHSCKVSSTCLVQFDRNRYSVDCAYANQVVTVKVYATRIDIFARDEQIASHHREFGRDKTIFDPWHYLPLLERKPGALRNGAPFKDWKLPSPIIQVKKILMRRKGGSRECVDVLLAMSEHGIEAVSIACELALSDQVVSRDYILNALHRLRPTVSAQPIETPVSLKLKQEPTADCQQYNVLLRETSNAHH